MADTNTQVKFLKGHSSRLSTIAPQDGHFYLTEDTHKLYAGIGSGDSAILALLNHDITFVNKVADLTTETHSTDQLYYAKDENVLAIYNETAGEFVQINPDDGATSVAFTGEGAALTGVTYDATKRTLTFTRGDINAAQVKTTQTIKVTTSVGNYTKGQEIAISDIENILLNMLCTDSDPSATAPGTSITLKNNTSSISSDTSYEVGTTFTPKFAVSNSVGKYTANGVDQSSGVSVNSTTVTEYGRPGATSNATASGTSGGFDSFTIADGTSYYMGVSTSFSDGVVPTTYLGKTNDKCKEVQIKATTKTNTSKKVTGYRSVFYGYKTGDTMIDIENITSAQIRALTGAKSMTSSLSTTKMQQLIFAFPATMGIKSVTVVGEPAPRNIKKLDHTVNVEGANGHTAVAYDVFYCSEGSANDGAEKFTISTSTTA